MQLSSSAKFDPAKSSHRRFEYTCWWTIWVCFFRASRRQAIVSELPSSHKEVFPSFYPSPSDQNSDIEMLCSTICEWWNLGRHRVEIVFDQSGLLCPQHARRHMAFRHNNCSIWTRRNRHGSGLTIVHGLFSRCLQTWNKRGWEFKKESNELSANLSCQLTSTEVSGVDPKSKNDFGPFQRLFDAFYPVPNTTTTCSWCFWTPAGVSQPRRLIYLDSFGSEPSKKLLVIIC